MTNSSDKAGQKAIYFCIYAYGLYGAYLVLECLDFLSLLHTPEPGFHATYELIHVAFFIVELIVYVALTLGFITLYNQQEKKPITVVLVMLLITIFRIVMIYYLYWFSEPKVHFVPYIYKKSNELSGIIRGLFLPAQIIGGIVASWIWLNILRKSAS
ncbi:MAG: hypothetical protein WKF66_20835 [Pedobacter sp.]